MILAHGGTINSFVSVCLSSTMLLLISVFLSSHGSASQEFTKFCNWSGSSLLFKNSMTISDQVKNLEYRALIQKETVLAFPTHVFFTSLHSPLRSIFILSLSVIFPPHSWHMYTASSALSLFVPSFGNLIWSNWKIIWEPQWGQGTKNFLCSSASSWILHT